MAGRYLHGGDLRFIQVYNSLCALLKDGVVEAVWPHGCPLGLALELPAALLSVETLHWECEHWHNLASVSRAVCPQLRSGLGELAASEQNSLGQ